MMSEGLFEEFKSNGVNVPHEPKDYPYGMRDFDIADLDGNELSFGMETKTGS